MTVLLPQRQTRRALPVLYLFHGLCGDHRTWCGNTMLEHLAQNLNLAIVMPDGGRGFFIDMAHGLRYGQFFAAELPKIAASMFPVSTDRDKTFAAGASMGGYGALHLALSAPERFGAVFAMSPLVDLERALDHGNSAIAVAEMRDVFGEPDEQVARGNELHALARKARAASVPPRIAIHCGTGDMLYQDSVEFCGFLNSLEWPELEYSLDEEGKHDWSYWSRQLPALLEFCRK